jgi:hypothetical protein
MRLDKSHQTKSGIYLPLNLINSAAIGGKWDFQNMLTIGSRYNLDCGIKVVLIFYILGITAWIADHFLTAEGY